MSNSVNSKIFSMFQAIAPSIVDGEAVSMRFSVPNGKDIIIAAPWPNTVCFSYTSDDPRNVLLEPLILVYLDREMGTTTPASIQYHSDIIEDRFFAEDASDDSDLRDECGYILLHWLEDMREKNYEL